MNRHLLSLTPSLFRRHLRPSSTLSRNQRAVTCAPHVMKRGFGARQETRSSSKKKPRLEIPEYHLTPSARDEDGEIIWPAPQEQVAGARDFIKKCAEAKEKTLICPDKDADGLSSGVILHRTLTLLGLPPELISVHLLSKARTVHDESEREAMEALDPSFIFVLDHGSRKAPPLIRKAHKAIVIDHHYAHVGEDFPEGAEVVTACHSPPVATTALLTYSICRPLHNDVAEKCSWLCALGTFGDLGSTIKWEPPFPDMKATFKTHSKKAITDAVALVNAPRRTATFDVISAWDALSNADTPSQVQNCQRLHEAKAEVAAETERCTHTPPKFSRDGSIAVLRISSGAQVHPIIATRWSGHLKSPKLEIVMCANEGYMPGKVNFSCRIAKVAKAREGADVDIIRTLEEIAKGSDSGLRERMGKDFARGHVQASGGIVGKEEFEEMMVLMGVGEKPAASPEKVKGKSAKTGPAQKNTLANYFVKK